MLIVFPIWIRARLNRESFHSILIIHLFWELDNYWTFRTGLFIEHSLGSLFSRNMLAFIQPAELILIEIGFGLSQIEFSLRNEKFVIGCCFSYCFYFQKLWTSYYYCRIGAASNFSLSIEELPFLLWQNFQFSYYDTRLTISIFHIMIPILSSSLPY